MKSEPVHTEDSLPKQLKLWHYLQPPNSLQTSGNMESKSNSILKYDSWLSQYISIFQVSCSFFSDSLLDSSCQESVVVFSLNMNSTFVTFLRELHSTVEQHVAVEWAVLSGLGIQVLDGAWQRLRFPAEWFCEHDGSRSPQIHCPVR